MPLLEVQGRQCGEGFPDPSAGLCVDLTHPPEALWCQSWCFRSDLKAQASSRALTLAFRAHTAQALNQHRVVQQRFIAINQSVENLVVTR